jgi:hypothetical protein
VALLPLAGRGGGGVGEVQVLNHLLSCGAPLQSLPLPAGRGGEGWVEDRSDAAWAPASLVLCKKSPLYLVFKRFSSELIHAGGYSSVAIFCRHGGASSTSSGEAIFRSGRGCSIPLLHEVIRSPWRRGGPWLQIVAGRGLPSSWPSLLAGDASRTPAIGGDGAQGPICILSFCSRVLFVIETALSAVWAFPRTAMLQGRFYNLYSPRVQ